MVFPCLDGTFCGNAAVKMRGNELEFDIIIFNGALYLSETLVIKDVESWSKPLCFCLACSSVHTLVLSLACQVFDVLGIIALLSYY